MPKIGHVHTVRLPLRKICSALPAVALISAGIMLPASAAPGAAAHVGAASKSSRAIVVPDIAMTLPGSAQTETDPFPMNPPKGRVAAPAAPALQPLVSMLPAGTRPGGSSPVTLDSTGIPVNALDAYRTAAKLVGSADPGCHIDWALLAAIGRVESDHGRFGGNQLDSSGEARPGIFGIALDGSHGTARILDTDHGRLDRDTVYDRAVGPMQFTPSTWRVAGVDANGDGVKDPQNMADAAAAAGVYLCSGRVDLSRPDDLRSAILRYNDSDSYAAMVTAIASAYRLGVTALPASALTLAPPTAPASASARRASKPVKKARRRPASGQPRLSSPQAKARQPVLNPSPSATTGPTSAPAVPAPATTQTPPSSTQPSSTTPPAPTSTPLPSTPTCVPTPLPTSTASPTSSASPTPTQTSSASPTSVQPCAPVLCLPTTPPATPCATPTSTG
jgi:membrane-bound lytic murein transglycosylase B